MHGDGDESDGSRESSRSCPGRDSELLPAAPPAGSEGDGAGYVHRVALRVAGASLQREEVGHWIRASSEDGSLQDHVSEVLAAAGVADAPGRLRLVEAAARRQQRLLLERRRQERRRQRRERRREEERRAAAAPGAGAGAPGAPGAERGAGAGADAGPQEAAAARGGAAGAAGDAGAGAGPCRRWAAVRAFATREEALRFVVECQPFDYRPLAPGAGEPPARPEGGGALAQVLAMQPPPSEFVSAVAEFNRCLRVRKLELVEEPPAAKDPERPISRGRPGPKERRFGRHHRQAAPPAVEAPRSAKEPKPWLVESAGALFERPASLRALRESPPSRYFVAVAPDVERRVLAEGFRVRRRCSIPCAATPKDALDAFARAEQRAGHAPCARASVLAVALPPDVDVVKHREGGFLIRCRELPASCFSRVKKTYGGEVM